MSLFERHAFHQIRNVSKRLQSGWKRAWTRVLYVGLRARAFISLSSKATVNIWIIEAPFHFSLRERVLVNRQGWTGSLEGGGSGEVWTSKFQRNKRSFLGGRMWNNWRRILEEKRSSLDRFISNIVLSCLLRGTNDLGNRETNEEQRKITRRRRKRKSKERIERGNIDEIRYFFYLSSSAFSRLHRS